MSIRDKWISGVFLFGVTVALWVQPSHTYSWMWNEAKDTGHEFFVGLLDITSSSFDEKWKVVKGGNQTVDLGKMIPGDERQLEAVLSKGDSDLDFRYKITAELKDGSAPDAIAKLAQVLRMRIESQGDILFDGLASELFPIRPGEEPVTEPVTEEKEKQKEPALRETKMELVHRKGEPNKVFLITVYLPNEGVDASYQGLAAKLQLRFEAKQDTTGAIYAE
ncbi:zinc-binding metallopeptidase family protein [Brevibacillus migulae]|uniref:hypothetical protein n=1 Tax=Brevibacillus migulae TaxID=1644114 RepID=UPI00106E43FB|nr:hypothetical protein [Brevibacillus migulae]